MVAVPVGKVRVSDTFEGLPALVEKDGLRCTRMHYTRMHVIPPLERNEKIGRSQKEEKKNTRKSTQTLESSNESTTTCRNEEIQRKLKTSCPKKDTS